MNSLALTMNWAMLTSVLVSVVVVNFVSQTSCKFIPSVSQLGNVVFNHLQSDLTLKTKQNVSIENGRIVGGDAVPIEAHPWIISLLYLNRHFCGGSIISPTRILTAAHCTHSQSPNSLKIRAGSSKLEGGQVVAVSTIIIHPQYQSFKTYNDISILILGSTLRMSAKVSVIGLPNQGEPIADGTNVIVSGWGSTREDGWASETLRAVTVPIVGNEQCVRMYGRQRVTKSMLCAGCKEGKKDSCQGDSGGPLSFGKILVGVVSWGEGCARPNYPGVYTRVAYFTRWIQRYM